MKASNNTPFFTIIIPTRNRPELFKLALDSVLTQSFQSKEIVVVNDGTDPGFMEAYKVIERKYVNYSVQFRYQIKRPNGHGQSYSINTGAYVGCGKYLCFLDDDDFWIDKEHLQRAFNSITASTKVVDVYYTNQDAYFSDGRKNANNTWIEDLAFKLDKLKPDMFGSYLVDVPFLLSSGGFAHLNCSIIRRQLYLNIKGMDENIRYECDRDIYMRTLDAAEFILYNPKVISKHHIPDQKKKDNMSTMVSALEKYLYQIVVYEKALLLADSSDIKSFSKTGLSYVYKHISTIFAKRNDLNSAKLYACKALALNFGLKWWLHTLLLKFRAFFGGNQK